MLTPKRLEQLRRYNSPELFAEINRLRAEVERLTADAERLAAAGDKLRRIVSGGWVPSERDRQRKIVEWDEALRQHEEQK